jgi:hypothetical protein
MTLIRTIFDMALISGQYYKHMTIVNYASSIVNRLKALLTDDARVVIYDRHVFILKATEGYHYYFQQKFVIHESAFTQMLLGSMSWHHFQQKLCLRMAAPFFTLSPKKLKLNFFLKKKSFCLFREKGDKIKA